MFALSNTAETLCGIVAPYLTSAITQSSDRETLRREWQLVFGIVAAFLLVGTVVFAVFGKGDEQEWAKAKPSGDQFALDDSDGADSSSA